MEKQNETEFKGFSTPIAKKAQEKKEKVSYGLHKLKVTEHGVKAFA